MLTPRSEIILRSIINWYIDHATPVSSQNLVHDYDLKVSSATVRNEMAFLEQEGYIVRPHTSAGSIPSDKGYRFYVSSLDEVMLPLSEQRMVNHLFHQVEGKVEEWLSLAAAIISRMSQNTAVITVPRPVDCQYRHLELVSIQDYMVLLVLVLRGARIKQVLLTLESPVSQVELSALSSKMNQAYEGSTGTQIKEKGLKSTPLEQRINESLVTMMQVEDEQGYNQSYLEGLHFMLNQPEFSRNQKIIAIMELLEHRAMLGTILPPETDVRKVQVVIGSENKAEVAQDCSLVISHYGPPNGANGLVVVLGPTRMAYPRVISAVNYLSTLLSRLMSEIYGVDDSSQFNRHNNN